MIDQQSVRERLTSYKITNEKLNEWDDQGMIDIFLKDWLSVYPSKYDMEDIHNVKIKTEW